MNSFIRLPRSLRLRLLAGASLGSATILTLLGVSIYGAMKHALLRDFDSALSTQATLLAQMAEQDKGEVTFDFDPMQLPDFSTAGGKRYFEVWLDDGKVLARSPSLAGGDLPLTEAGKVTHGVEIPGENRGHAYTYSFTPNPEEHDGEDTPAAPVKRTAQIEVAAAPTDAFRTLVLLGWMLTLLCTAAVVTTGLVLWTVVGRPLRPLEQIARDIESLRETDLSRRLVSAGAPSELSPVVEKLNELLARLQGAFAREKLFTADVAHELRTPLAGLRMTLEVCRSRQRDASAYETALDDCRAITDRMAAMVETLLMLARSDAGQLTVQRAVADLSALLPEVWRPLAAAAEARQLRIEWELPEPCRIDTDPQKLRIVLRNLLDNAVSHCDQRGLVRVAAEQRGNLVKLHITNTGSRIAAEDTPRLFERFWRGDAARTDTAAHCGLGLSLCQRLITLLGGEIAIETTSGGLFTVRLILPAAQNAPIAKVVAAKELYNHASAP